MATRNIFGLFVKQIPWTVDKRDLRLYFSKFGDIASISLPYDKYTGLQKGYATIWFADRTSYQKAVNTQRHVIEFTKLIVTPAMDIEYRTVRRNDDYDDDNDEIITSKIANIDKELEKAGKNA